MPHKLSDDTFIRSQSLPRNTTFQALSNPERKLENNVSIQAIHLGKGQLNEIGQFLTKNGIEIKQICKFKKRYRPIGSNQML